MNELIIVFLNRQHIGLTAIPYLANSNNNGPITLQEQISLSVLQQRPNQFSSLEKEVIQLLDTISDHSLFKRFSRQKSIKEFKDNLSDDLLEKKIRPYIEKTIYKLILLISKTQIPAYFKMDGYQQLYASERLKIRPNHAEPLFRFTLKEETLVYTLKLRQDTTLFSPTGKTIEILCHTPAIIKINHDIYHFESFSATKIVPFLEKPAITIAARYIPSYLKGFVANCISLHQVEAHGFTIEERTDSPKRFLVLERNLKQRPVLNLYFQYGDRRILPINRTDIYVDLIHNHQGYTFHKFRRNFDQERFLLKKLEGMGLIKTDEASLSHPKDLDRELEKTTIQGPENLVEWVRLHAKELKEEQIEVNLKFNGQNISTAPISNYFEAKDTSDWFEIKGMVEIPPYKIPFIRFRKNILQGNRYYTLPNGELFILPTEWFSRYTDLLNFTKPQEETLKLSKVHSFLMDEALNSSKAPTLSPSPPSSEPAVNELPEGLNATLRPYQKEGYRWLNYLVSNNFGGILADDMGLGKTIQTITFLLNVYAPRQGGESTPGELQLDLFSNVKEAFNYTGLPPSLIVMPTSLVHNWAAEIKRFAPSLKVNTFTGTKRARTYEVSRIFRHYHIVITTYGVLRNDIKFFKDYLFQNLILDESQQIKNPSSKSFSAVKAVNAKHHFVLTGTPIENSLVDLWAQMSVVNKDLLGSLSFFQKHFVEPITKNEDEEKSQQLKKLIQPFMLRRTKEGVAKDLPPMTEQVVYCEMTPDQKKFYETEKSSIRNALLKDIEARNLQGYSIMALKALTRLRQIANHPATIDPDYRGGSGKFDQMLEIMESILSENHYILIFSSFVKDLKLIEEALNTRKIHFAKLTGATQNRQEVIESFSQNDACKVFLISLKAGGIGLNLTKADYVFMLNPWWNPAAEAQAINRAHRIGQKRNVFVYRFISTKTIEEKIARLQEKKSHMAQSFVKSNNPLSHMNSEEIKELLG